MLDMDTDTGMGENPGAVLRRLRHTAGRRLSQEALATLLGTSRAHIARLELHGSPQLTDEQLDRLEKASDAVRPPFSRDEIDELRKAMQAVGRLPSSRRIRRSRTSPRGQARSSEITRASENMRTRRPQSLTRLYPPAVRCS